MFLILLNLSNEIHFYNFVSSFITNNLTYNHLKILGIINILNFPDNENQPQQVFVYGHFKIKDETSIFSSIQKLCLG